MGFLEDLMRSFGGGHHGRRRGHHGGHHGEHYKDGYESSYLYPAAHIHRSPRGPAQEPSARNAAVPISPPRASASNAPRQSRAANARNAAQSSHPARNSAANAANRFSPKQRRS